MTRRKIAPGVYAYKGFHIERRTDPEGLHSSAMTVWYVMRDGSDLWWAFTLTDATATIDRETP